MILSRSQEGGFFLRNFFVFREDVATIQADCIIDPSRILWHHKSAPQISSAAPTPPRQSDQL
jgi:hypothetical protein